MAQEPPATGDPSEGDVRCVYQLRIHNWATTDEVDRTLIRQCAECLGAGVAHGFFEFQSLTDAERCMAFCDAIGVCVCSIVGVLRSAQEPVGALDAQAKAYASDEPSRAPGTSILAVDDDDWNRKLLKMYLEPRHAYAICESAEQALAILATRRFRLVLTDLGLPGMSGIDLCKAVRTQYPETVVMMLTGLAEAGCVHEALAAGAFSFLAKPFSMESLMTLIDDALKHQDVVAHRRHPVRE